MLEIHEKEEKFSWLEQCYYAFGKLFFMGTFKAVNGYSIHNVDLMIMIILRQQQTSSLSR